MEDKACERGGFHGRPAIVQHLLDFDRDTVAIDKDTPLAIGRLLARILTSSASWHRVR